VCPECGTRLRSPPKTKCPSCGELISKSSRKCPACGVDIPKKPARAKSQHAKKDAHGPKAELPATEPPQTREIETKPSCPECGGPLTGTELKCPKCGHELGDVSGPRCRLCGAIIEKGLKVCPDCGTPVAEISEVAKPVAALESESVGESHDEVSTGNLANSRPCPSCGAVISKDFQKCPICLGSLTETKPKEEPARPEVESLESPPTEAPASAPPVKVDAPATRPTKRRTLKVAGVATIPAADLKSTRVGTGAAVHTTRVRKVAGKGAKEGKAFVNGTGISNGLGARSKGSAAKRSLFLTRWQFLAVLIAILIIIPTFVVLSYTNKSNKFSIDGNFSDWSGATTYGTVIQSTESTTNITEWAIGTQSSSLFLYLKTQANMMSSTDAESYYLFVDSDGSNATGYTMESIGADYMLELTGWDSAVKSTSLSRYSSNSDHYNWTAWTSIGSLSYSLDKTRIEAGATLPEGLGQSARFVLISKDSADRGSVSCMAPLKGGVLVVEQVPSTDVLANGVVSKSTSTTMLTLKFKCQGQGGSVDGVNPTLTGASLAGQLPAFSLIKGEEHEIVISVDTSSAPDGRLVAVEMPVSGIISSFASVEVVGSGVSAYVGSPPTVITIDGAFADWSGKTSVDQDPVPATSRSTDINQVGNVNTTHDSYFYVSVMDGMCNGTFVPATVSKPTGTGGGGAVTPARRTAEDILRIYIDSDKSTSTGKPIALNSKLLGADQMIEVKGLFGRITSMKEFGYSTTSVNWAAMTDQVGAAKDTRRMEIGVSAASIGGSTDIDFIVETTAWNGRSDLATFDPTSISASTKTWIVDPSTASPYATSMSYQRKTFYDGTNYWSFYYDGTNTVHKYSVDNGQTWTNNGPVFATTGVNETSIWYDSLNSTIYAIGDTSTATNRVYVQVGGVNAAAHTISWAASDAGLKTSTVALAGKNTYISKDLNGYLWVLSSNCTVLGSYQLSAFRSSAVNNASSWVFTGQMLAAASALDNVKGSIVPEGSGSNVWAIYAYAGNVAGKKYTGIWSVQALIYNSGALKVNTDNSPPSVVVDGKGVVHVVYGTGYRWGQNSIPRLQYSHNNTGLTTFTPGLELPDPLEPYTVGDYYPTISLDASTGNLFVFWIRGNSTFVPITVMGSMCVSGTWSYITFEPQTNFTKQYLTSVYSASSGSMICWQWTQNTTTPFNVVFDTTQIPEFGILPLVTIVLLATIVLTGASRRKRQLQP
jgi:hypothetical protein